MGAIGTSSSGGEAGEIPEIGVGMLGYAFMGKAHTNAYKTLTYMTWPPPLHPKLVSVAGRNADAVAAAAARYGYESWTTDWHELVADPRVGLFDNGGPNDLHAEPTIAAARAGKHVLCEKPLGRTGAESFEIWREVAATGVKHMCAFNYRFVPAIRMVREMVGDGELGEIRHFRGRYLQDWGSDPTLDTWRFHSDEAGTGALGDLGAHVVDLARFLVGEVATVSALASTFVPGRQVDFHTRGRRIEEQIEVLRMLWTQDVVHFKGEFHDLDGVGINPLPVQRPIPIWIGGWKDTVLRRAARMADGLCFPMRPIPELKQMVADAGRDPEKFGFVSGVALTRVLERRGADHGGGGAGVGGVTHVTVSTEGQGYTVDEHIEALTKFKAAYPVPPS